MTERDMRTQAATRAMWSDHPLNIACRKAVGETFSVRDLIAFVRQMPQPEFNACMFGARVIERRAS